MLQRINTVLLALTLGLMFWLGRKHDPQPVGRYTLFEDATGNITVLDTTTGMASRLTMLEGRPTIAHFDLMTETLRVRGPDGRFHEAEIGKEEAASPKR